jgi:hypothetical protein
MNERIKELVQHAVLAVDIVTGNEALDDELSKMYIPDCFAEKLAELIVQECAKVSLECGINLNREDFRQGIARNIKQHFGVEE